MGDAIHHHKHGFSSSLLYRTPPEISKHLAGTACELVVACDKSCCSTLDGFELLNVSCSVWVPGGSCILNHRSGERSVALISLGHLEIFLRKKARVFAFFVVSSTCLFQVRLSASVTPRYFPCFTCSRL